MMDAQDKQWNSEVSFSTMHVYYHIKATSEKAEIGPFKQDYYALKWLIDDLQAERILRQAQDNSGFQLTGTALEVLLEYLTSGNRNHDSSSSKRGMDTLSILERSREIRRYSRGDRFRDLSVRHTLREIARNKRTLAEVRESDLRIMPKEHKEPHSDIVLCIDTSGSMGFGQKLTYARLAAAGLVKAALRNGDKVGIIAFGDRGQTVVPMTGSDEGALMNGIATLCANGNTNIGDGMKAAREFVAASRSRNRKHMILVTDGQASAVSEDAYTRLSRGKKRDITEESALWETNQAAAGGIQVSVVCVAPRDEEVDLFVRNIATAGRGRLYRMKGLDDLRDIFCSSSRTGRSVA
jgi:Mg-chelatase subunit ChlD